MIRQYYAQTRQGGNNPLGVGTIATGSIYYLQDDGYFRDRWGPTPVFRKPWIVEAFHNDTMGASRVNRETGKYESTYVHRQHLATVRSLRDRRRVKLVTIHFLKVHEDLYLHKGENKYPSLPDVARYRPSLVSNVIEMPKPRRRVRKLAA